MQPMLEVKNLSKKYPGSNFHLKDITFSVPYGSITGFIGENGAGKTTTMGTIIGTIRKNSGTIKIFGEQMHETKKGIKEQIGVVFDQMSFSGNLNAMKLANVMTNIYQQWDHKKYMHYLDRFSLPKKQKISSFSRGMSMKLSLAVALSHGAKLLILDEATAGLDPIAREEILEVLLEIVQDKQHSILLSSHITSDIEKVADNLLFIKHGKLILQASKNELLQHYAILRCQPSERKQLDENNIIAYRNKVDYIEVLVANKHNVPMGFYKKNVSIDDITMLLMKGEKR